MVVNKFFNWLKKNKNKNTMLIDLTTFKELLGYAESGGNYQAIYPGSNPAYGKYQFTRARLVDVSNRMGRVPPTESEFLNNPALQELYFETHVQMILEYIDRNSLRQYEGMLVKGKNKYPHIAIINLYGLVAGAHLGGEGGLRRFLQTGYQYDPADANGTHISDYIAKFSDNAKKKLLTKLNSLPDSELQPALSS